MREIPENNKYATEAENDHVRMEIDSRGWHRLVNKNDPEDRTDWAPYTGYTYLNGWVGCTAYYTAHEAGEVLTPEDFIRQSAIGKESP